MKLYKFILIRLLVFVLVVFIGMNFVFILPRLMPSNPVEGILGQIVSSAHINPEDVELMRENLNEIFGLDGSLSEQYFGFMKRVILTQDFGPSFTNYPTPVIYLIRRSLPWTLGLLGTTAVISWILGNAIGLLAGVKKNSKLSNILEGISIFLYPIPYYIVAIILIALFSYIIPIFPIGMNIRPNTNFFSNFGSIIYSSILPSFSILITSLGWWIISMKTLSMQVSEEDYITFARMKGLSENKVITNYILPNTILSQVTMFGLQLGTIFGGALITEVIFGYPGMGSLIYNATLQGDYNLIIGSITVSIITVATSTLILDLIYPFLDPRVRYR